MTHARTPVSRVYESIIQQVACYKALLSPLRVKYDNIGSVRRCQYDNSNSLNQSI